MKTINFKSDKRGILITGFTPMMAVAICLKIQAIEYQNLVPQSNGDIQRWTDKYTVFTTAMMIQLALAQIGESPEEYKFKTNISRKEIEKGDWNNKLNLVDFNFTQTQLKEIAKVSEVHRILLKKKFQTKIKYSIIKNGDPLDINATISSIFQFTKNTPRYAIQVDSGGQDMDEGYMTALIAETPKGYFTPYLCVNNEGQEVSDIDLKKNYNKNSFLILDTQKTKRGAKNALLKAFEATIAKTKPFMKYDEEYEYWIEPYEINGFKNLTVFEQGFMYSFCGYFDDNFSEARKRIENILKNEVFLTLDKSQKITISKREIEMCKKAKEFRSFNFILEK